VAKALTDSSNKTPLPDPLTEEPPNDRWCDIVMKGGVASGVVYPWAILEIARKYRLRNLGGTSVGAMAAALAAACEYGRRLGHPNSFEVLRLLPTELGKRPKGNVGKQAETIMLSLFQPAKSGKRLFAVFVDVLNGYYNNRELPKEKATGLGWILFKAILNNYFLTLPMAIALVFFGIPLINNFNLLNQISAESNPNHLTAIAAIISALVVVIVLVIITWIVIDIRRGIIKNDLGLCRGITPENKKNNKQQPALVEWMHQAIQRGAGLAIDATPLTFEDLWRAPLWPGGSNPSLDKSGNPLERSIDLQMVTTNVTHGRPYRLPLVNRDARLFFNPDEWKNFFPDQVMNHLNRVSTPYTPLSESDPTNPAGAEILRELPAGKLPVVVAARLSLSYPLLFSTVPLYAIDYEEPIAEKRELHLCRFSDGGLCSNFPVHFFDTALPRWPTFGLSLEERNQYDSSGINETVWLPDLQEEGTHDTWYRIDKAIGGEKPSVATLGKFLWFMFLSSKDWRDKTAIRMPHVRRRVVRLRLLMRKGEGQMNIAMPEKMILEMAKEYGIKAGKKLCEAYAPDEDNSKPKDLWREHLWVRSQVLIEGLSKLLSEFSASSTSQGHTQDTSQILQEAAQEPPIKSSNDKRVIWDNQRDEIHKLIARISELENALSARSNVPHKPQPLPELRFRPRL